ncbi:MAG: response regulator [Planctomycetes bacterium]|nr:response regulator [Planctomycetota bacterium]
MTQPATAPTVAKTPQRILVVDDEPDVLQSLTGILERAGYSVTATTKLATALGLLDSQPFDLALTDLYLGATDLGFQLADRARCRRPEIPVVLLTGKPSFDRAQEALRSRVSEIVVKPIDPFQLLTTCRRTIEEYRLARRNQELVVQNKTLASVLPRAVEAKDPTTSGHAERVVDYVDSLARRCNVSAEDRESLRMAALLHDVGKIGIPDDILTKPGALTEDERDVIKRHPRMGYEILGQMDGQENVRRWVYQHHERWDGKGYPEKLAGEDVALPGRILVLAEVYDALAEQRSYKRAWETSKIVAYFRDQAGRQFDPDLAHVVADGLERMGPRFFAGAPGMLF